MDITKIFHSWKVGRVAGFQKGFSQFCSNLTKMSLMISAVLLNTETYDSPG